MDVVPLALDRELRFRSRLMGACMVHDPIRTEARLLLTHDGVKENVGVDGTAHAERMLDILDKGGEAGKKIDFLAQEMNREANTLVSKSTPLGEAGLPITEAGLRLKAEIEKIREQAQNLE